MFLRILQALCTAYGWTLEMDRRADLDLSCAIFADSVWVDEAAADLNEEALSDLPFNRPGRASSRFAPALMC